MINTRSSSAGKVGGNILFVLLALVGTACAIFFTTKSDFFSSQSTWPQRVKITPGEAVRDGAQWRVVSQWQDVEGDQKEPVHFVEFKALPGWTTPLPVVLKKGEGDTGVVGVYQRMEYPEEVILRLEGSTTMSSRLAPELAQYYLIRLGSDEVRKLPGKDEGDTRMQGVFHSKRKIRTIQIKGGGTPWGFSTLSEGMCDLAMAAGRPSPDQAALFSYDITSPETEFQVGMEAVAIVVHRNNPVQALTKSEVGKIFRGEITNWSQVGGSAAPITIFTLGDTFGAKRVVQDILMDGEPYAPAARSVYVHSAMSASVSADPYAIGFCSLGFVQQCRTLSIKEGAGINGVSPTPESIRAGTYPAIRNLYFYRQRESKNVHARDFIRLAQSIEGQDLVDYCGFVSMTNISPVMVKDVVVESVATSNSTEYKNAENPPL